MLTNTSDNSPDFREIQFSSVLIALVLFLAYQLGRVGTGDALNLNPLILSTSIILLPDFLRLFFKQSVAILQVVVLLFFFALGWISILLHVNLTILVQVIFLVTLITFFRKRIFNLHENRFQKVTLFIFIGLALVYLVWMQDYMNPLAPEAFAAGIRYSHVDTLFHSALTANIKTYTIASLGLEGLPAITYHSGSHYLFASYSQLCKVSVLEFYNFAYPVIFVPLFVQSLLFASYANLKGKNHAFRITVSLVILFIVLTGFYSSKFGARYLLPPVTNTHFMSPSYNVSLTFTFLAICVYAPLLRISRLMAHPKINTLLILCIPLWLLVIGYTKVSTSVVVFMVFLYIVLRKKLFFNKWISVAAIASSLVLYYVMQLTVPTTDHTFNIQWGSFYKVFVNGNILIYFLLQYLYFALLVTITFILLKKKERHFFKNLIRGKYIVAELIVVTAFIGIIPGLLIYIDGGSAYYFSDIQYWLTVIALIHFFPYVVYKLYSKKIALRIPLRIALFALAILITREAVFRSFYYYTKKNIQVRMALASGSGNVDGNLGFPRNAGPIFSGLKDTPGYKEKIKLLNLKLFKSLRALPEDVRSKAVIYCEDPQQLERFLRCSEATFYIPAMSEMAMINGLYWRDTCYTIDAYGMKDYAGLQAQLSKEEAKTLAREKGFKFMIVINLGKGTFSEMNL